MSTRWHLSLRKNQVLQRKSFGNLLDKKKVLTDFSEVFFRKKNPILISISFPIFNENAILMAFVIVLKETLRNSGNLILNFFLEMFKTTSYFKLEFLTLNVSINKRALNLTGDGITLAW